jgi:hypothetical protein
MRLSIVARGYKHSKTREVPGHSFYLVFKIDRPGFLVRIYKVPILFIPIGILHSFRVLFYDLFRDCKVYVRFANSNSLKSSNMLPVTILAPIGLLLSAVVNASPITSSTDLVSKLNPRAISPRAIYSYKGCYTESTGRTLNEKQFISAFTTIESCSVACSSYLYFGVENGNQVSGGDPSILAWT